MKLEQIVEPNEAYILGLIFADGNKEGRSISLQEDDKQILIDIANYLELPPPIYCPPRDDRFSAKGQYRLNLTGYASFIRSHNGFPNKTLPIIPNHLQSHFIRGLFDGDGCISLERRYQNKYPNKAQPGTFYILLNKALDAEIIKKILTDNIKINDLSVKTHRGLGSITIYKIVWSGTNNLILIRNYLYSNADLALERKKNKFFQIKAGDRIAASSAGGKAAAAIKLSQRVSWNCQYCGKEKTTIRSKMRTFCSTSCSNRSKAALRSNS